MNVKALVPHDRINKNRHPRCMVLGRWLCNTLVEGAMKGLTLQLRENEYVKIGDIKITARKQKDRRGRAVLITVYAPIEIKITRENFGKEVVNESSEEKHSEEHQ